MLIALAIYQIKTSGNGLQFNLVNSSIGSEPQGLFSRNPLRGIEEHALADLLKKDFTKASVLNVPHYFSPTAGDHYYSQFLHDASHLLVIRSRSPLDDREMFYLLHHMRYVHHHPKATNITLEKIFNDPLFYGTRDSTLDQVVQKTEELKNTVLTAMDNIADRHKALNDTERGTVNLELRSRRLKNAAEDMNKCCFIM